MNSSVNSKTVGTDLETHNPIQFQDVPVVFFVRAQVCVPPCFELGPLSKFKLSGLVQQTLWLDLGTPSKFKSAVEQTLWLDPVSTFGPMHQAFD